MTVKLLGKKSTVSSLIYTLCHFHTFSIKGHEWDIDQSSNMIMKISSSKLFTLAADGVKFTYEMIQISSVSLSFRKAFS